MLSFDLGLTLIFWFDVDNADYKVIKQMYKSQVFMVLESSLLVTFSTKVFSGILKRQIARSH